MNKNISDIASFKLQFAFAALMMLLGGNLLFAQNSTENKWEENKVLAYDTPFSYNLDTDVQWELKNEKGRSLKKGKGNIDNQIFSTPGNYTLYIKEEHSHNPNSCDHAHFPEQVNITVSPMKMVFDFSSVKFSEKITGAKSAKGIVATVNVDFSSFDNSTAVYKNDFTTAGVGTSVIGKLKNEKITLKKGMNTLEFLLDGQASKGNYIMIDFKDINGQVQRYDLTQIIQ